MSGKRIAAVLLALVCALGLFGCEKAGETQADGKLQIVATLFPQYDFARQVAGEYAEVTLLLPPGVESHSFEPTPADIIKINEADLFIYTGEYMEPWAQSIIDGLTGDVQVLDISRNIPLDEEAAHEDEDGDAHEHGGFDPHIWTSPANAMLMVDNLSAELCAIDPEHAGNYQTAAAAYKTQLDELDQEFQEIVDQAQYKEIVFGGRFAMHYFAKRYGLSYLAAFDSCSSETEPSAKAVAQIIDEINEKHLPAIFHEELADPKVSRMIAEETGVKLLLLHSCHNVSKEEAESGATYLSLMQQNAENLREGLV